MQDDITLGASSFRRATRRQAQARSEGADGPGPIELVVHFHQRVLEELRFDQPRVRIGRAAENDVQLDNLALSRFHAEIVRVSSGWVLRDRGSRNGVHVNGRQVRRHHLNRGDVIALGKFTLAVRVQTPRQAPRPTASDPDSYVLQGRTLLLSGRDEKKETRRQQPLARLELMGHRHGSLPLRESFHVGAAPDCELRLEGWFRPRKLALIVRGRAGYSLLNVSPRGTGVLVNGKPVAHRAWLQDEDRLDLGGVLARFHARPPQRKSGRSAAARGVR